MNILSHGHPFWSTGDILSHYAGEHVIRTLGKDAPADFVYDPETETAHEILKRVARSYEVDLVIFWFPEEYPPPLDVVDCPVLTVGVIGDWDIHYSELVVNHGRFDAVISDMPGSDRFDESNTSWGAFPIYACPPFPKAEGPRDIDCFFAGTCNGARHSERNNLLARLWPLSDRYRTALGEGPTGDDYVGAMQRSRIVMNKSVRGELNMRFFETIAAGAVPLLEMENAEAEYCFSDVEECCALYEPHNLEETVAALLEDPARCERITAAGREIVTDYLGIDLRLDSMVAPLEDLEVDREFGYLSSAERHVHELLFCRAKHDPRLQRREDVAIANAMKAHPNDPHVLALAGNRALHRASTGDGAAFEDARDLYRRAIALSPNDGIVCINAATAEICAWAAGGQSDAACLRRAEELLNRASVAESMSEHVLFPDHWDAFWCSWQRDLAYQRVTLNRVHAEAHHQLARLATEQGGHEMAADHLKQAAALASDRSFAEAQFNLAYAKQDWGAVTDLLMNEPGAFYTRDDVWELSKQIAEHTRNSALATKYRQRANAIIR